MSIMIIREALPRDRPEITALYVSSQMATGVPSPEFCPPEQLGDRLYARQAIGRFVAVSCRDVIVGHGLIEYPNPEHIEQWRSDADSEVTEFIELGGAFVDLELSGNGIWSALLAYRLEIVRAAGAVPVSVTWDSNHHVMRHFARVGGREVGRKSTAMGAVCLYRFER